jgi:auxin efflux carrier family protein
MASSLLATFLAAGQASSSVLLVALYGVVSAELDVLDAAATKRISSLCVRILLPALLLTRIGSELEYETFSNYIPVFGWAICYNVSSLLFGLAAVKSFGWPRWIPVAAAFNNTTSLPLLLMRALESTGVLKRLLLDGDTMSKAISRAQSYFLACSIIGNCLTFAVGPHLMKPAETPQGGATHKNPSQRIDHSAPPSPMIETSDERTSLLSHTQTDGRPSTSHQHQPGPQNFKSMLIALLRDVFNEPTVGALLGLLIGVVPALHRAFFASSTSGGVFTPWLTASLVNIGQAFVPLQVFVVGVTLSQSFHQGHFSQNTATSGTPSRAWSTILSTLFILGFRFILWPLISLPLVYLLAVHTNVLGNDPILWFSLMLMPAGPPAMKLIAMANVGGAEESAKIAVARVLAVSYVCVPMLSFTVVAALDLVHRAERHKGML